MYNGSKEKTRISLTIEHDLKAKLEEISKAQERSLNNLIIFILKSYVDGAGK